MSGRTTPASGALENLKREAKRWLKELRANVAAARRRLERVLPAAPPDPTLRDVQLALAREHGFSGWAELKARLIARTRAGTRPSLADYDQRAVHLLEAYRTGTPDAMERHWRDTWHRRSWEAMRRYVQLDIGKRPPNEGDDVDITLDDARLWVARDHGFHDWSELAAYVASISADKRAIAATPVRVFRAGDDDFADYRTRDWDAALERLASGQYDALDAHGQMTDDVLQRLERIEHVTVLGLGGSTMVTSAGLRSLARLTQLTRLDLSGSAATDDTLEIIGDLPALERLELAWTRITDAGARRLSRCARLARLNLAGTNTGDRTIESLAGIRLTHFRSGEGVTDAGIPLLHDLPVFKRWQGGSVQLALLSPDAEPNMLGLRGTLTDRGMQSLAGLDGLFGLSVDAPNLHAAALAPLVTLPNLGFLAFDAADDAMPHIGAMPHLRFLMCQDTEAGDDGFAALARSRSIEYIWGRRCHNLGDRGFVALAAMPALRSLSVSCKNVGDAGLASLPRFAALRELMPMDVPDDGYRHIGRCEQLESLILMYCRETGDAATEHVVHLPRLSNYFASYTRITDRTPELLAAAPALERIELSGCAGVTNDGVAALAAAPALRELRLSGMQQVTRDATAGFPARIRVRYSP
jgi:hypothetical protein